MKKYVKIDHPSSSVNIEMILPDDHMQQIIRVKDEVNRLKKQKKGIKIAQSFDCLEIYNTTLPNHEEILLILRLLTKAKEVYVFKYDDPYAREGLFLIDIDNWIIKVSAI